MKDKTKPHFNGASARLHNRQVQFIKAAEQDNIDYARQILLQGGIVAETFDAALVAATHNDAAAFVQWLIDEVHMDLRHEGAAALETAVSGRNADITAALIAPGVLPLDAANEHGMTLLDVALSSSLPHDAELFQFLLDQGAKPSPQGYATLDRAASAGNDDAVDRLLPCYDGMPRQTLLDSRLADAARRLDADGVNTLLRAGADSSCNDDLPARRVLRRMNDAGHSRKDAACCLHALFEAGAGNDDPSLAEEALLAAIHTKNGTLVHYLLREGIDIEHRMNSSRYNPLVVATEYGYLRLIEQIHRERPQDPLYYCEAMEIAARKGNIPMLRLLLSFGIDPHPLDRRYDLALAAAGGGNVEVMKELMGRKLVADIKSPDLLKAAIEHDHGDMTDFLLDQGASPVLAQGHFIRLTDKRNERSLPRVRKTLRAWEERYKTKPADAIDTAIGMEGLRSLLPDAQKKIQLPGIVQMTRAGRFREIASLLRKSPEEKLTLGDLQLTDGFDNTLIELLGAHGSLGAAFDPALWPGRATEHFAALKLVPPAYLDQIDAQSIIAAYHRENIQKDSRPHLSPKRKGPAP